MNFELTTFFSNEGFKLLIVLFLSFLIGLEREEKRSQGDHYYFGGVRTFPLVGLLGYTLALISGKDSLAPVIGFAVIGAFMAISYLHKISSNETAGMTTEITGLLTFMLGILVEKNYFWIAVTIVVASVLLLELKAALENLAQKIPGDDIAAFTKFLLITAVILPIVPNRSYTVFQLNPFKSWLIVVAVSAVSFVSYLLQKLARGRGGILLSAILGGAYSSTVTTVVLSRKARGAELPHLFASSILIASSVMYLRIAALVYLFNSAMGAKLLYPFLALGVLGIVAGLAWLSTPGVKTRASAQPMEPKNPLELKTAFLFAAIFVGVLILTDAAILHMGLRALYSLAAVMGVTDVDPFIMGLTQAAGKTATVNAAAAATLIAASSNNLVKGLYALIFADRKTGILASVALVALAVAGVVPLFLI